MDKKRIVEGHLELELPELIIEGDIGRDQYRWVFGATAYLRTQKCTKAKLIIDSNGGDVDAGLDIYDVLRLSGIEFD